MKRLSLSILIMSVMLVVFFAVNLIWGAENIPVQEVWCALTTGESSNEAWTFILLESRLPQAITALFCGAGLSVAGLMLQTIFSNPLAGPSILGINTGASLGVALIMLLLGGNLQVSDYTFTGYMSVILGAFLGAMFVLGIILFFSTLVKSNLMLLIIGIMVGYIASSAISLLNFFATAEGVHSYMAWGMGNFSGVTTDQLGLYVGTIMIGLIIAIFLMKPLNALLLGQRYAENLGVNIRRVRIWLLIAVGLLVAITTAFCGPVSFLGLAVPHVARMLLGSSNHNGLLPFTMITGAVVALFCNVLSVLPGSAGLIPLNAVTPVVGAPVIIYVIINQRRLQYFN